MIDIMGYIQLFRGKLMVWVKIEHPMPVFLNHWVQRLTRLLASHHWIFFCSGTLEILERSRSCLKNVFPVDGAGSVMKLWSYQAPKRSRPRSSRNFPDFDFKVWSLNALYLASTRILPWPLRKPSSLTKFSRLRDSLTPRFLDLVQSRHVGKLGQFWCYASLRKQMNTWSNTSVIPSPLYPRSPTRGRSRCAPPPRRERGPPSRPDDVRVARTGGDGFSHGCGRFRDFSSFCWLIYPLVIYIT